MRCSAGLALLGLLLAASPTLARTWHITPDGSGDAPTIQAGVDSASAGDEVVLADGVFSGMGNYAVSFQGKAVVVRSSSGDPSSCVIDCEENDRAFSFASGEGTDSVLDGIRITNGNRPGIGDRGGAIYCLGTSPTFRDLRFDENRADVGGAIHGESSSPMITGCVFEANTAGTSSGGAISLTNTNATIEDCLFRGNRDWSSSQSVYGGGAVWGWGPSLFVRRSVFSGNFSGSGGGAIHWATSGDLQVESCTFVSNRSHSHGGAIYLSGSGTLAIDHSIVRGNCAGEAGADVWVDASASLLLGCSVWKPGGIEGPGQLVFLGDNLTTDPLICEVLPCPDAPGIGGVYSLARNSPALDDPTCGLIGALGEGCTTGLVSETWGRLKSRYRIAE